MATEHVIGVDLGGTKLLAGVVDVELGVHHRVQQPADSTATGALLDQIARVVAEVREQAGEEIVGVGFGIPCLMDAQRGVASSSVHLPLDGVPFVDVMLERLGLPVFVDNDANLALLAEHRAGAARGARNAVMLTIGTGIGGGLIIDGELYRGARGAAGELGHMVVDADGPICGAGCPNRGCLEAVASGSALVREATLAAAEHPQSALARTGRPITGPLAVELAHDGEEVALKVIGRIGSWLGVGIASLLNIFDPDIVVVGGGVIAAGELLLEPARIVAAERSLPRSGGAKPPARIVAARFGAESGMLGAAMLAYDS
ncbi:MAG: ROK family protein, partial [Solirubrobacteraceae bacterium]